VAEENWWNDPALSARCRLYETQERIAASRRDHTQLSGQPCTRFAAESEADQLER